MQVSVARIALLLASLNGGGAERNMLRLGRQFCRLGHQVDLLVIEERGELLDQIPDCLNYVPLGVASARRVLRAFASHALFMFPVLKENLGAIREHWDWEKREYRLKSRQLRALPKLRSYLRKSRPKALLTTLPHANLIAVWARRLAGCDTRVIIREANMPSLSLTSKASSFSDQLPYLIRRYYRKADGIVAVSSSVADDLASFAKLPRRSITVITNPVDVDRIQTLCREDPDDPWFAPGAPPVILAVGRLTEQKDYPTLLQAFAGVARQREARLLVLGNGKLKAKLEHLARELGIDQVTRFQGFVQNVAAYMGRSSVFALSSRWEGYPNVLIEALVCGCPVVSTDCPGAPREILGGGRYGTLVPVGDAERMTEAILSSLDAPPGDRDPALPKFLTNDECAESYLNLMDLRA